MHRHAALALTLSLLGTPLAAQRLDAHAFAQPVSLAPPASDYGRAGHQDNDQPAGTGSMLFTGFMGGALGFFGGGAIGYALKSCHNEEWFCGMEEAAVGAMVGEILLLPYGVHVNSRHSPYALKLLASIGIAAAGIALGEATGGVSVIAAVPVQLVTTIAIEHAARTRAPHNPENAR